jgi:DNA (cytosine-5)-methyltransferase 1
MMLRHVDLCSGIGGFSLGFEWAELSTPILFCDTEPWCRKILAKNFPNIPIATDVKELAHDPERLVPDCDILTAGYPCQPFSVAGKQKGTKDDRHIWPYILRIVAHKRPTWCVFENVHGHIALGLDQVLLDLEAEGYSTRTFIVPACGVNAPHRRDRLWIVGNAQHDGSSTAKVGGVNEEDARGASQGQIQAKQSSGASGREDDVNVADTEGIIQNGIRGEANQVSDRGNSRLELERCGQRQPIGGSEQNVADTQSEQSTPDDNGGEQGAVSEPQQVQPRGSSSWSYVADTSGKRRSSGLSGQDEGQEGFTEELNNRGHRCGWGQTESIWSVEPDVGRVAHGIPRRVDRLKGLGNAIVPQIAMNIGLAIKEQINGNKI